MDGAVLEVQWHRLPDCSSCIIHWAGLTPCLSHAFEESLPSLPRLLPPGSSRCTALALPTGSTSASSWSSWRVGAGPWGPLSFLFCVPHLPACLPAWCICTACCPLGCPPGRPSLVPRPTLKRVIVTVNPSLASACLPPCRRQPVPAHLRPQQAAHELPGNPAGGTGAMPITAHSWSGRASARAGADGWQWQPECQRQQLGLCGGPCLHVCRRPPRRGSSQPCITLLPTDASADWESLRSSHHARLPPNCSWRMMWQRRWPTCTHRWCTAT